MSTENNGNGPLRLKSTVDSPLQNLSETQRGLLFSELAMVSYLPIETCRTLARQLGFPETRQMLRPGIRVLLFQSEFDSIVVFRWRQEPKTWADIKTDAVTPGTQSGTVGKVHWGFKNEADSIWPTVEGRLDEDPKPIWFTGHSLGGAVASICAGRCLTSRIRSEPTEVHTFGSPRTGSRSFAHSLPIREIRWVVEGDPVPQTPPVWMGFQHGGEERFIDRHGKLFKPGNLQRSGNGVQSQLRRWVHGDGAPLNGHSINEYVESIFGVLRSKGEKPANSPS